MTTIEAALGRLVSAYQAAGGTTEEFDPVDEAELDDLRRRVAPLRVPGEIEHVWRQFQELGVPGIVDTNPLGTAELAIGAMGQTFQSRALLVIGSPGRATCYLELDDHDGTGGGAVWTLGEFAPQMHEAAPSLAALFDATAVAWERGIVRLSEQHPFPWAAWDEEAWDRLKTELLPVGRVAESTPTGWLPRWLAAEGLTAAAVAPRGRLRTIAELLAAGVAWRETETVRGRVTAQVVAMSDAATINDGTGELVVYVPRDVNPFGLLRIGRDIELDVRRFPPETGVEAPFEASAFEALALAVREA